MRLIDADALLHGIDELAQSPWFNHGKEDTGIPRVGYNERKEAVEIVRDLCIKSAPTVTGWISVEDRLPEYTGWYLTYHHKINLCVVSWFTGDGWEDGDWGAYEDGWVSHWMPLPEDPKEVSKHE